jgi:hypothetical protein
MLYQQLIEYLRNTWLSRKEQFCKAWTCRIRHYGVITTSALEGLHASIKRWLYTSQNDLDALVRAITLAAQGQDSKIRAELAINGVNITSTLRSSVIKILPPSIHQFIAKKALQLIAREYYKAVAKQGNDLASLPSCTGSFLQIYGLPCAHQIRQSLHITEDWKIGPQSISNHWYIQRPFSASSFIQPIIDLPEPQGPRQPDVLPPATVRSSGRPRQDRTDNTTRRDPSHWEIPQGPQQRRQRQRQSQDLVDLTEIIAVSTAATAAATAATAAAAAAAVVATAAEIRRRRTSSLSPPAMTPPWTDWVEWIDPVEKPWASTVAPLAASEPVAQPVSQPASQPELQPASEPASQPASQLVSQLASQLVSQLASQPALQPSQLASQLASQLVSQAASQPESQPESQPIERPQRTTAKQASTAWAELRPQKRQRRR